MCIQNCFVDSEADFWCELTFKSNVCHLKVVTWCFLNPYLTLAKVEMSWRNLFACFRTFVKGLTFEVLKSYRCVLVQPVMKWDLREGDGSQKTALNKNEMCQRVSQMFLLPVLQAKTAFLAKPSFHCCCFFFWATAPWSIILECL